MIDLKKLEFSPSLSILIAGVLIAGAIIFTNQGTSSASDTNSILPASTQVPAPTADDHIIGSPTAPIVLIEYSDFQCYYCMQAYPTIKRIVDESQGQIAWVMRHLPLESIHPEARPAAQAAECITEQLGNDGWWKFTESMFTDQENMGPARYLALAGQLGADTAKYMSCVSSNKYDAKINQESADAQVAGAQGTPYTVVYGNGAAVPISGALPYQQFMSVIEAIKNKK
ncbi:MAG: oxidoreductase [Candidatus Adlerbacteria bacterium]|nr:oxidoreductase [Candidatus Adlerbacteria bacterium]